MNILFGFIFFFILTSLASAILDLDGDRVRPGVEYQLIEATMVNSPYISLVPSSTCPSNVGRLPYNILYPTPLPITVHPVDKEVKHLSESTKFNIRTEHAEFCLEYSQVWKVSSGETPLITAGGEIGDHKRSIFSLEKAKNTGSQINAYNLFHCEEPDVMCSFAAIDNSQNVIITGFENHMRPVQIAFRKIREISNV